MIADILLVAGALGAGFYCYILSRRLTRFNDLENGVGGAVAVLSAQVDDLTKTLATAQNSTSGSQETLEQLTQRAETVTRNLELMMAAMHDVQEKEPVAPETQKPEAPSEPMFTRHSREQEGV